MNSRAFPCLTVLLAALLLAACAAQPAATSSPTASPTASPTQGEPMTEESAAPSAPTADISEEGLEALVATAAEEADVDIDEIRIVTAEQVMWSDGSIGCPQPGQGYTQALVPGFRVVLEIDGEELHFHAARGGEFRICDDPQPPVDSVDR